MPFESSYDPETGVLRHRARGEVGVLDLVIHARSWHDRLSGARFQALWDLRGARLDVSLEELLSSPPVDAQIDWVNRHRSDARHCYLVDSELAATMLRFLEGRGIEAPWAVFREETSALAWLLEAGGSGSAAR